jgi:hypothetical protein
MVDTQLKFAEVELLREMFDSRDDWRWMTILIEGAIGVVHNHSQWCIRYRLDNESDKLSIEVHPPDEMNFMDIPIKRKDFELSDPKVLDHVQEWADLEITNPRKEL